MGAARSRIVQTGEKTLHNLKKAVDNLPTEGITKEELDRVLEQGNFRPKTNMLLKEATERMNQNLAEDGLSNDETIRYVQSKDETFLSQLEGTYEKLASESMKKPDLPFSSEGELPKERRDVPLEIQHIPGMLKSDEIRELFSNSSLIETYEGQRELTRMFDLTPENMDNILKFIAYPKLEKRRDVNELDAVWPAWKKDLYIPFLVYLKNTKELRKELCQCLLDGCVRCTDLPLLGNPTGQLRLRGLLCITNIHKNHRSPVFLMPKGSSNCLVHGFHT